MLKKNTEQKTPVEVKEAEKIDGLTKLEWIEITRERLEAASDHMLYPNLHPGDPDARLRDALESLQKALKGTGE